VERNHISSLQSHAKALQKECCLPGVFRDSGDTPGNLLCKLNGHLMPCTSYFYGKWIELCVLANLEYLSILFCAVFWAATPGLVAVLPMCDSAYVSGTVTSQAIVIIIIIIIFYPR